MKVYQLRALLNSLAQTLSDSGARQVGSELTRVHDGLKPFDEFPLSRFADFLAKAEEYASTGLVQAGTRKPAKAVSIDEGKVKSIAQKVRELEERSIDSDMTYQVINSEVNVIGRQMSKDETLEVAKQLGLGAMKTKANALKEIEQLIVDRKESAKRVPM